MACTGLSLSSPSISCLDFLLDWDLSGATPTVKITNNSTVSAPANLKWWIYITAPAGNAIYGVDVNTVTPPTPDFNGVAWTTKVITLPTPFGNPPCGQIEFSPNSPYSVTVFVQDSAGPVSPIPGYTKNTIIVRPNGNTEQSCGNFGNAKVNVTVDCANKVIVTTDGTKLIYNNILTPLSTTQKWTLVYPADPAGDVPNTEVLNVPNVQFPISVNSKGYVLYFNETAKYDYGNGITVTVQYKLFDKGCNLGLQFAVNCNTNLCQLQCMMKKFYEKSRSQCGKLENAQLTQKMVHLQWIFSQILSGIFQPACGNNVPELIEEMKREMGMSDDCDCGCGETDNFGFSYPTGSGGGSSPTGCCPLVVPVLDKSTGLSPTACPGSFFPAAVFSPDGSTIIGVATDADSMVSIINANPAWMVYGTAFNMGNCQVGFYKGSGIVSIPPVLVQIGQTVGIVDGNTGITPASCPATPFPANVYEPDGTTLIGSAGSIAAMIAMINANPAWEALGTAYYNSTNCSVAFIPATGVTIIPSIIIKGTTGCVGGIQRYTVTVEDICGGTTPPITTASFPLEAWVDFGSGLVPLGAIVDNATFIADLNAAPGKPPSVTFSAGPLPSVLNYNVDNTDCTGYSGVVHIYTDANSGTFMFYAGNHLTIALPHVATGGVYAGELKEFELIGKIPGLVTDVPWWHVTMVQNRYLLCTVPSGGNVYCWDLINPLMPALVGIINLPDTGSGNCFTGIPQEWGVANDYGLYFPTDYHNMTLDQVYVYESNTGSIWHCDFTGSPHVVKYYASQNMIGACPRVHYKGSVWFSQDGDYRTITGPGIGLGQTLKFDASATTWGVGNMHFYNILTSPTEEVWAASFDPTSAIIYFSGKNGSIVKFDPNTASVVSTYIAALGQTSNGRLNTKFYLNKLYHSTYGGFTSPGGLTTGTIFIDTTTLGAGNVVTPFQPFLSNNATHWNFLPLGNCLGILTYENGAGGAGFAIFKLDGTVLGNIPYVGGASYNVVPIGGISVYTPTTLV